MTLHDYKLVAPCYLLFRDGHECHLCVGKTFPSPGVRLRCVKSSVAASLTCAIEQSVHRPIYRDEVDAFIVPSTTARNLVLASGAVRAEDIHVVPHGVEIPAALATAQDGPAYMLFLGRLSPEKGGTCLLEAWRRANLGPEWELLIAGEGADRASLERQAAGMRIRFLGHVGDGEIQRLLYGAAAMVVPSLFPETFGLSAAEAMAAGVPVLVSNVGNLPDLIGRPEQVVAPGDPAAWADAIRDIAKSPTRRARLAATARERIETEFSPVVAAVRTEAVYVAAGADRSES
jgi:glycosyltransferase involved in cell wall biosynthesis